MGGHWDTGLFDCFSDIKVCKYLRARFLQNVRWDVFFRTVSKDRIRVHSSEHVCVYRATRLNVNDSFLRLVHPSSPFFGISFLSLDRGHLPLINIRSLLFVYLMRILYCFTQILTSVLLPSFLFPAAFPINSVGILVLWCLPIVLPKGCCWRTRMRIRRFDPRLLLPSVLRCFHQRKD